MVLGDDIKAAYTDVGTAYSASRRGPGLSGELETGYLDFELNRQVTKPFIREYFIEASLPYDTECVVGDVLEFTADGRRFILMNLTADMFENQVYEYQGVLYKCNVTAGKLERSSGEDWDENYHKESNWVPIDENVHALQAESLYGHSLETDIELGQLGLEKFELYIPSTYDIRVKDRWTPVSGEWYLVTTVKKRRFDGVDVAELREDRRDR
jgi:hypothetical protein